MHQNLRLGSSSKRGLGSEGALRHRSATSGDSPVLFIVCPHSDDFDGLDVVENLVDETMLNINSSGACSRKVTDKLLIGRWGLVGIFGQNPKELFCLGFKTRPRDLFRIAPGLIGIDKRPTHQSRSGLHFSTGVFNPLAIDSRMPGIDVRYSVS